MKAWRINSFGIDQLAFEELPEPQPGAGEVLVKVHAVSLNYRDLLMVRGQYNPKMALPRIPCSDGAGEIVAVGDGVTTVKTGQRVAGIFMQRWLDGPPSSETTPAALGGDVDGMLAEYVVLPQSGLVAFPEYLSYAQASTLPCAAVTAWNALTNVTQVKPGDVVVTQGTGGVSVFALQFAKLMGATVLGTSSRRRKVGPSAQPGPRCRPQLPANAGMGEMGAQADRPAGGRPDRGSRWAGDVCAVAAGSTNGRHRGADWSS